MPRAVLRGYVLSTYSARKLGLRSTGNAGGVHNLTIDPGKLAFQGRLKELGADLLVTEMMEQGVNMATGDYSRGAAGFWVENGEIQYPVEEITIAGNLKDMLKNIVAVGNDIDYRVNIRTGSILVVMSRIDIVIVGSLIAEAKIMSANLQSTQAWISEQDYLAGELLSEMFMR